jgi:hypothetical protein
VPVSPPRYPLAKPSELIAYPAAVGIMAEATVLAPAIC